MLCRRYNGWKAELVKIERHILKELGFSFYIIDHAHKFILRATASDVPTPQVYRSRILRCVRVVERGSRGREGTMESVLESRP